MKSLLYQMHYTALYWTGKQITAHKIHNKSFTNALLFHLLYWIDILLLFTLNDKIPVFTLHMTGFVCYMQF